MADTEPAHRAGNQRMRAQPLVALICEALVVLEEDHTSRADHLL